MAMASHYQGLDQEHSDMKRAVDNMQEVWRGVDQTFRLWSKDWTSALHMKFNSDGWACVFQDLSCRLILCHQGHHVGFLGWCCGERTGTHPFTNDHPVAASQSCSYLECYMRVQPRHKTWEEKHNLSIDLSLGAILSGCSAVFLFSESLRVRKTLGKD